MEYLKNNPVFDLKEENTLARCFFTYHESCGAWTCHFKPWLIICLITFLFLLTAGRWNAIDVTEPHWWYLCCKQMVLQSAFLLWSKYPKDKAEFLKIYLCFHFGFPCLLNFYMRTLGIWAHLEVNLKILTCFCKAHKMRKLENKSFENYRICTSRLEENVHWHSCSCTQYVT